MTENPRVGGSIPSLATNKIKNLGRLRKHRVWNKIRQVEYRFHSIQRSSIVEYAPRCGIFSHSGAYFSARPRTPRLPHVNHLRRLPVAVSEPIVYGFEVVLVRRVLGPKGIEREGLLQYRFEMKSAIAHHPRLSGSGIIIPRTDISRYFLDSPKKAWVSPPRALASCKRRLVD